MIPIKPTVADNVEMTPNAAANGEPNKKRIPLISIPATLSIGLLIAAVYLGGRIVTAHRSETPVAPAAAAVSRPVSSDAPRVEPVQQPAPAPEPAVVAEVKPIVGPSPTAAVANSDDAIPMITPQNGERYIQVGALDNDATRRYVQRLRNEKFEPHVAPGPKPELLRILLGPFDNPGALDATKAQLQTEGIDSFVRKY